MIGDAIAQAMTAMVIAIIVCTAAVTAALIFGLPWLWGILKPILHALTA